MKASARHILVATEDQCEQIKKSIASGSTFTEMASKHSDCPSGKNGGNLGTFAPGQMVEPFNTVVFTKEVGELHGPVKTQFGWHLIEIMDRTE